MMRRKRSSKLLLFPNSINNHYYRTTKSLLLFSIIILSSFYHITDAFITPTTTTSSFLTNNKIPSCYSSSTTTRSRKDTAIAAAAAAVDPSSSVAAAMVDVALDEPIIIPQYPSASLLPSSLSSTATTRRRPIMKIPFLSTILTTIRSIFSGMRKHSKSIVLLWIGIYIIASFVNDETFLPEIRTKLQDAISSMKAKATKKRKNAVGVDATTMAKMKPMTFDQGGGWGKCILESKTKFSSNVMQYTFTFSEPNKYMNLKVGQVIKLCGISPEEEIFNGKFHIYYDALLNKKNKNMIHVGAGESSSIGSFNILLPTDNNNLDEDMGTENANLIRFLEQDVQIGDEIALQPGENKFEYHGDHLPVTEIFYLAYNTGIVPVLDQIRAFLPEDSSASETTIRSMNVVWVSEKKGNNNNNNNNDNYLLSTEIKTSLENLHSTRKSKLNVNCIFDNLIYNTIADNTKITSNIERYVPGMMVILSGIPKSSVHDVKEYLHSQYDYPTNCICIL